MSENISSENISSENTTTGDDTRTEVRTAGTFDIRTLIGGLIGLYGIILTVTGLWFTDAQEKSRANGSNLNLTVGIALIVFGAIFIGWALLRPLRIRVEVPAQAPGE